MSETERLIEFVRERRFLYDYNDPDYKNRQKRLEAWKDFAAEMGAGSGEIWSAKWKGLKDNYAKYKKTSEPAHAETYKKYKNWPWAEHVSFLDDYNCVSNRRVFNYNNLLKLKGKDTTEDAKLQRASTVHLYIPVDGSLTNLDSTIDDLNIPEQDTIDNRKRKIQNGAETYEEDQDNHKARKPNEPALDGVDHFFLSYAQSFKKLPNRMQIMLKLEIATLFSRYELQAEGVTKESVDNISRIVPLPVKCEYDFINTLDD